VALIDDALLQGIPYRDIAGRHDLSKSAVERHRKECIPLTVKKAHAHAEDMRAAELVAQIKDLHNVALDALRRAQEADDVRTILAAVREGRENLVAIGKLTAGVNDKPIVNVHINTQWVEIRTVILRALEDYPEARWALSDALAAIGEGNE